MAKYFIDEATLLAIADAIREKKGTSDKLDPSNFALEIAGIVGGGIPEGYVKPEGVYYIDTNGDYDIREYAEVRVQVSDAPVTQSKHITIGANGKITILPDEGFTLMREVIATVEVPTELETADYYNGEYEVI